MSRQRWLSAVLILSGSVIAAVFIAMNVGTADVSLWNQSTPFAATILWETRLPRILLALCVGMALGASGTAYQALLRNPLADPYILGVSGGAALGAALGMSLGSSFFFTALCAFGLSFATMLLISLVARGPAEHYSHSLLLTGVVFNAFAFACILLIHVLAPVEQSHAMLLLLMGNLSFADLHVLAPLGTLLLVGLGMLLYHARALDALSLGTQTAESLGIDSKRLHIILFAAGSILVGAAVAVSGLIGFVGLFIPHAMRLIFGHDHRTLIPTSALAGGAFLVLADAGARSLLSSSNYYTELPVGVITAMVGAPCFVWLLRRRS